MKNGSSYTLDLREIDRTKLELTGGKGANLGELFQIKDINMPEGFCITTEAYREIAGSNEELIALIGQLVSLKASDTNKISELSVKIRKAIEGITIPEKISDEINRRLEAFNENDAFAVRSSATAEDLPTASFAGQQDTYLNVIGKAEILKRVSACFTSLFSDRAIIYRIQIGFDHRKVHLAVIIQKMIIPQASGILFTADPLTSNRKIASIDASFGLGEALVSGLVDPDIYKVRNDETIEKKIAAKKISVQALKNGGTEEKQIEPEWQNIQALTDAQILELARLGRKIEKHFGGPQDIEWCLDKNIFYIMQSRPITTLYPIPQANDNEKHVYISVGHQQMMTDAMKPLGISFKQLTAARPMHEAGGRLFVDVAQQLASPASREMLLSMMEQHDPLFKDALVTILENDNSLQDKTGDQTSSKDHKGKAPVDFQTLRDYDPSIVQELIGNCEASLHKLKQAIQKKTGSELMDLIEEDLQALKKELFDPRSFGVIMTSMNAALWLNEKMKEWLGEKNAADTISQSVPNNITSEMGLALLDVADAIRPYPEVIAYLEHASNDDFLNELSELKDGKEASYAITAYLEKYGMRCVGEIDITRTRWSEKPLMLVPLILSNIRNFEAGESRRKFEEGRQKALKKEQELLERLKKLTDGEQKAREAKRMIGLVRNLAGYREYPKYDIVRHYFVYKQALLEEAQRLLQAGLFHEKEDIYYLRFDELREVLRDHRVDHNMIARRKEEYRSYKKLSPPRVITSDGETATGRYRREHLPAGAIIGLPVSSGSVEGRARVILSMQDANIEEGDILVTAFTDPSWTPLFVLIKGLITEVGGLMTHGAVIAREYGLPAVVGVENATRLIRNGQRIKVNGTDGYIEILD